MAMRRGRLAQLAPNAWSGLNLAAFTTISQDGRI
jgi:hypothetical protein